MRRLGAVFSMRHNAERTAWHYHFRVERDGDDERCRTLFSQAQADPEFFALVRVAVFVAIMRDAMGLPERAR